MVLPIIAGKVGMSAAKGVAKRVGKKLVAKHTPDSVRGIQNAQARFREHSENRLTSARIYNKRNRGQGKKGGSGRADERTNPYSTPDQMKMLGSTLQGLSDFTGTEYDKADAKLLVKNPPTKPDFPSLILAMAVFKDLLDIPGELSLVGIFITTPLSFLIAIILFIWFLGKLSGGWWKKGMIKWLWKRYALAIVIEFIPFAKMLPATTILVLMAHFRETKIAQMLNAGLESLRGKKLPFN